MTAKTIQRFYKTATAKPVEGGYAVMLDGRPVKTPHARVDLMVPSRPLAEALVEEWEAQDEKVRPEQMPLTGLAFTAHDVAGRQRDGLIEALVRYADTDLVCYRAPEPVELVRREHALWQPLLDWLALSYDARLDSTTGILPIEQPAAAKQALASAVADLDAMHLAALSSCVRAAGSLVVGLALLDGQLDAAAAFDAAEVERTFQIEQWGEDAETAREREGIRRDLEAAERFLALLTDSA